MLFQIDACVAQHQGDRAEQQDRCALIQHPRNKSVILGMVADGMGGHVGGAQAAEQILFSCRSSFAHYDEIEDQPDEFFRNLIGEAHTMINSIRNLSEEEKEPQSTVVMLIVQKSGAYWAHTGDSRLYYFRGKDKRFITRDHSFVEMLLKQNKITKEEAEKHPNRNVLVTSVGGTNDPIIDCGKTTQTQAGDAFFLCSDGLWTYFSDAELGQIISRNSAKDACKQLIDLARLRSANSDKHGDNMSLVLIKLGEIIQQ